MIIKLNKYGKAMAAINAVIAQCKSFKIGKTGMEPFEKRLDEPDYSQDSKFTNIKSVYQSDEEELVSDMEAYLIDKYINHPKCKNKKDGDDSINDNMADADIYTTYIVWN